ncbi:hypothetical protein SDC9_206794 [bioreactor metagenome]|uniref:Uncharacterized protein n=1 Tax=bioreactor metagenome TaxID=1076179 RepID=A0A645J6J4_9ZZZZ
MAAAAFQPPCGGNLGAGGVRYPAAPDGVGNRDPERRFREPGERPGDPGPPDGARLQVRMQSFQAEGFSGSGKKRDVRRVLPPRVQ